MFKKLSLKIDVEGVLEAPRKLVQVADVHNRGRYKYTEWQDEDAPPTPLLMYTLPTSVVDEVLKQLPAQLLDREVPGVYLMRMPKPTPESKSLPPHIDRGRRAAINVYLRCGGETTQFFSPDEDKKALSVIGEFTAKEGEAWLMDVSLPHAVMMREAQERVGLSISFRKSRYAELARIIEGASAQVE
jgi:hypothetical protein